MKDQVMIEMVFDQITDSTWEEIAFGVAIDFYDQHLPPDKCNSKGNYQM